MKGLLLTTIILAALTSPLAAAPGELDLEIQSTLDMAIQRQAEGRYEEAVSLFEVALERVPAHALLQASISNRAGIAYQDAGRYLEAERSYTRAVRISRELGDVGQDALASSLNNLGSLHTETGRLGRGRETLVEALRIRERAVGPESRVPGRTAQQPGYRRAQPVGSDGRRGLLSPCAGYLPSRVRDD